MISLVGFNIAIQLAEQIRNNVIYITRSLFLPSRIDDRYVHKHIGTCAII